MFERMTLSQIAAYLEEAATLSPEEEQALLRDRRAGVRDSAAALPQAKAKAS